MQNSQTTTNKTVNLSPAKQERQFISIGSFITNNIIETIQSVPKPQCDFARWTITEQLHISWQVFHKVMDKVKWDKIQQELQQIEENYFPIMLNFPALRIMPNQVVPTYLMWEGEILEVRKSRDEKIKQQFYDEIKNLLHKFCVLAPSIQIQTHMVLARFPKNTSYEQVKNLLQYELPTTRYSLEKLSLIEAKKAESGMSYSEVK